ncbi:MAG: hypothetical protein D6712_04410 [Chloroflexi bacterium]|nr:MAG: hypothetical protein D6712_04410 [Chloroflexota bacterium]
MADDFNFDDDETFDFGGEFDEFDDEGIDFGDDELAGFGDEDLGDDFLAEDDDFGESESSGPSRTFILIAAMMFIVFLVGVVLLIVVISRPTGPTPTQLTATSIVMTNEAVEIALRQTDDANATQAVLNVTATSEAATQIANATATTNALIAAQTSTADALFAAQTATAQVTPTAVPTTPSAEGTEEPTDEGPTPTASNTPPPFGAEAVQQTATALALTLQPVGTATPGGAGGAVLTPTVPSGQGGGSDTLPDTGLFDDGLSITAVALMALGLLGVIFFSRKARAAYSNQD